MTSCVPVVTPGVHAITLVEEAEIVTAEGVGAAASVLVFHPFLVQQLRGPLVVDGESPALSRYRVQEVRVVVLHVHARGVIRHTRGADLRRVGKSFGQTRPSATRWWINTADVA